MGHDVRHPGEILRDDFLKAYRITSYTLVRDAGMSPGNLSKILRGESGIGPMAALRLGRYFDNGPMFWMTLQAEWDIAEALEEVREDLAGIARWPERRDSELRPRAYRSRAKPPELHKPRPERPKLTPEQIEEFRAAPDIETWARLAHAARRAGVTNETIGKATGVTRGTVGQRLHRHPEEG